MNTVTGSEKSDTEKFWLSLLRDVLGIEHSEDYIEFQKPVDLKHTSYIDAYISSTRIIIEQKSKSVDLDAPAKQSDGAMITPFEQAKRYRDWLPASEQGRYIIVCNFLELRVHDMETPKAPPVIIACEDITRETLLFLVQPKRELTRDEIISLEAGRLAGRLYDSILPRYKDSTNPSSLRSLNILCVRVVFLLYAEHAGIFEPFQLRDYLEVRVKSPRSAFIYLFKTLKTPVSERDPYIDEDLAAFPYIDGGLFEEEGIEIPRLDGEPIKIILEEMSVFKWDEINPTIFGALFESTLGGEARRTGGMHYTTIENIHRVIDPLFLDELRDELEACTSRKELMKLRKKLTTLTFLDPACGSGNFLTEAYLSLCRLEMEIIRRLGELPFLQVSINQFYGIEVNDFAVSVAKTALWIANIQTFKEINPNDNSGDHCLPLSKTLNIFEDNAVRLDWSKVIAPKKLSYIMGNPPFRGARIMNPEQKQELASLFSGWGKLGDLDYVCCWYKKAFDFMKGTKIRAAFVSTNSINQGDTVSMFWKPLTDDGLTIDFAYRTFVWSNEAEEQVHVNCMIVGFSDGGSGRPKRIYVVNGEEKPDVINAEHINAYILDAPDWYIENRTLPLCDVPTMRIGNKPIDGGNYLFTREEYEAFVKREPKSKQYFHLWYGGREFLYNEPRMCLYLGNCTPHQIKIMPACYKRVVAVRKFRLASQSEPTQKLADDPIHFHVETFPTGRYIVIPQVSSERRTYIPIGFLDDTVMCSSQLKVIENATIYHFGVLESLIHMAWVRVVAGRLRSDYRYSSSLVYNCFVWPQTTIDCRLSSSIARIEQTAQAILDTRAKFPDSTLADLYNDSLMPTALRKAHQDNDEAVREAYGFPSGIDEYEIVTRLMKMYSELVRL